MFICSTIGRQVSSSTQWLSIVKKQVVTVHKSRLLKTDDLSATKSSDDQKANKATHIQKSSSSATDIVSRLSLEIWTSDTGVWVLQGKKDTFWIRCKHRIRTSTQGRKAQQFTNFITKLKFIRQTDKLRDSGKIRNLLTVNSSDIHQSLNISKDHLQDTTDSDRNVQWVCYSKDRKEQDISCVSICNKGCFRNGEHQGQHTGSRPGEEQD